MTFSFPFHMLHDCHHSQHVTSDNMRILKFSISLIFETSTEKAKNPGSLSVTLVKTCVQTFLELQYVS